MGLNRCLQKQKSSDPLRMWRPNFCFWEPEAAWHESTWISQKQASFSSKGFGNGSLGSWSFNGNPHQIRKCCDSNHPMETLRTGDFWTKWVVVLKHFLFVTPTCKDQIWQPCFTNGWINHQLANHVSFSNILILIHGHPMTHGFNEQMCQESERTSLLWNEQRARHS